MSRIYFHSQHGTAEVSGRERAHCGVVCGDIAVAALAVSDYASDDDPIRRLVPTHSGLLAKKPNDFKRPFDSWFRVGGADAYFVLPTGERIEVFALTLNTCLVLGSDALKFMARLHGQCEIHAYVEGPHRAWLADIIAGARAAKMLRADMGWEGVIDLLRARDDEPVVTSYSVCHGFPNAHVAKWHDAHGGEDWYELPPEEQWRLGLKGLRERGPKFTPDDWAAYRFEHQLTVFDVREIAEAAPNPA